MINFNSYPKIIDEIYKDNPEAKEILLKHSFSVAKKALSIIDKKKLDLDKKFIFEGAMLHDIGIIGTDAKQIYCYGDRPYLCHGIIGAKLLEGTKFEKYKYICLNHTGVGLSKDEVVKLGIGTFAMEPRDLSEKLITYVDNFYSKSNVKTLQVELQIDDVIRRLSRFGKEKVKIFYEFHALFS
ncbi:MAG: HDIG domain-containing metalloprotein [Bdellovibrionota bacterium]